MDTHDKYGFRIIRTGCDLLIAKNSDEKYISQKCQCCSRQVVIPIEQYGFSCKERLNIRTESVIK